MLQEAIAELAVPYREVLLLCGGGRNVVSGDRGGIGHPGRNGDVAAVPCPKDVARRSAREAGHGVRHEERRLTNRGRSNWTHTSTANSSPAETVDLDRHLRECPRVPRKVCGESSGNGRSIRRASDMRPILSLCAIEFRKAYHRAKTAWWQWRPAFALDSSGSHASCRRQDFSARSRYGRNSPWLGKLGLRANWPTCT